MLNGENEISSIDDSKICHWSYTTTFGFQGAYLANLPIL